ncbi:MAG: spore coat protein U-like protein [Phenylobacterium sp.]|jgi:spore coat protein U-like protein
MKTLIKTLIAASLFTTLQATAAISVSDTNSAVFILGGTIEPMCKVNSTASAGASALIIDETNASQDVGTLEVWCNTGSNATTKYASANNGFLVDGSKKIAYTLDVGNFASDIDLASEYTASATEAGTDRNGTSQGHALKVTPQSTGLDAAGTYSDTITVTVSYN